MSRARLPRRWKDINFARLNHILIPQSQAEQQRFRTSRAGRLIAAPLGRTYLAFTPEGRVLFAFSIVLGFSGMDVDLSQNHVLWALLTAAILVSLVVRRAFRLRGVDVRVDVPARVQAGDELNVRVRIHNRGAENLGMLVLERPFLPWDGAWITPQPRVESLAAGCETSVSSRVRFLARGWHHLDGISVSQVVPLRIATGPGVRTDDWRVLVVPRVATVERVVVPQVARHQPGGVALASKTGESMELMGVRPYRLGDRLRDIHARTWARTGEPAVREYQQEFFSRIGVVVDTDLSVGSERRLEAALSLTAGVLDHLARGEALIDLLVTGEELHALTLGRSLGHVEQALDHLACVEAGPVFSCDRMVDLLRPHLQRLSSVVLITLHSDDERARLARSIREAGVSCTVACLFDPEDPAPVGDLVAIDEQAVLAGRAVSL